MTDLVVNGQATSVSATVIQDLLKELGFPETFVAVAINHTCVKRGDFGTTPVATGDEVEILSPMAGG